MKKKIKHLLVVLFALTMLTTLPSTVFAATPKTVPGKVALTKISSPAYNKITINWKKTTNATAYNVYYKKAGTSKYTKIASVKPSATAYTHVSSTKYPIIVGQKYTYTVRAYNQYSKKSGSYNTKGLTTNTLPSTAKLKKAVLNNDKTQVTISWNKASGCNYYVIYRTTPLQSNKWSRLTTVSAKTLTYTDKNPYRGVENRYTIRAYYSKTKAYGKYDIKGVAVDVPTDKPTEPTDPTNPDKPSEPEKPKDILITQIDLNKKSISLDINDDGFTLIPSFTPANNTETQFQWSSDDTSVATITNGIVTPVAPGETDVWIESKQRCAVCHVTVIDKEAMVRKVVELTNQERAKVGAPPLQMHPNLQKASMVRAREIAQIFSHTRPDGRDNSTALFDEGVAHPAGENIHRGYRTPEGAVSAWMNSSGHKITMLRKIYTHIGVGLYIDANNDYHWVQNFTDGDPDEKATLICNLMGGTINGSNTYQITAPSESIVYTKDIPIPEKPGYTFAGWYRTTDYHRFNTPMSGLALNGKPEFTIYAKWDAQ